MDEYRHDHGDSNDGALAMEVQNNDPHHQYVSFSRKIDRFTGSQPINFTQIRINADSKQATNNDMSDHGGLDLAGPPVVWSVEGAEEKPDGPSTLEHQHDIILSNLANLSLGLCARSGLSDN